MKVKILGVDTSILRPSSGSVVVRFLYDNVEHIVHVYPGQDIKERIRKAINDNLDNELGQLEAESFAEKLKSLEGTELDIEGGEG